MKKASVLVILMCFLFSVSEIMAAGTAPRMRRTLNRAWKAQVAKEKAMEKEAARLEKELEDLERKLFEVEKSNRRIR